MQTKESLTFDKGINRIEVLKFTSKIVSYGNTSEAPERITAA